MKRYIISRLLQSLAVLLASTVIVFALARLSGDVLQLYMPPDASKAQMDRMREILGLNEPVWIQYGSFLGSLLKGDLGKSISLGTTVSSELGRRIPLTLQLAGSAMAIALAIGISVGVLSATRPGKAVDKVGKFLAITGQATPTFWLGIMLMLLFAVRLGWLPVAGKGGPQHLVLPAFAIGWSATAALMRITRSAMLDVLDSEYIKMARIKGVPEYFVILKHALRNAVIPILTVASLQFAGLLNGTVVTESVFALPGVGRLALEAIYSRDYPMVQGVVLMGTTIFVTINFLVDILYAFVDPRIRYN